MRSRSAPVVLSAFAALLLAGCSAGPPDPEPSPTPTQMTEDEAFAAAEETYRALVDAQNEADYGDPSTFDSVYTWLTGDGLAEFREDFSRFHAEGWKSEGRAELKSARLRDFDGNSQTVVLDVCLDVSQVRGTDAEGNSIVSPERPDIQPLRPTLVADDSSPTGMVVSNLVGREDGPACDV